mmetsp:Transcript_64185/g.100094  ORF Transcript_64185/g.100094 Transcript_64185/m.100094 type:complete len:201 (+) Transcript_64185:53-655(+)
MAVVSGPVKNYNADKGWGFVEANGTDIFLRHNQLGGRTVQPGDILSFTVTTSEKGIEATNCTVIQCAEERYKGAIKSFKGGYGFINCEAFPELDIFFSAADVPQNAFYCLDKPGAFCTFTANPTEKGIQAQNVKLIAAAGKRLHGFSQGVWQQGAWQAGGGKGVWKPQFQKAGKGGVGAGGGGACKWCLIGQCWTHTGWF